MYRHQKILKSTDLWDIYRDIIEHLMSETFFNYWKLFQYACIWWKCIWKFIKSDTSVTYFLFAKNKLFKASTFSAKTRVFNAVWRFGKIINLNLKMAILSKYFTEGYVKFQEKKLIRTIFWPKYRTLWYIYSLNPNPT